jgi:hypothetical protein
MKEGTLKVCVTREELFAICNKNEIQAKILSQLLYWSTKIGAASYKNLVVEWAEETLKGTQCSREQGWIFKSAQQLKEEILTSFSSEKVRKELISLIKSSFIQVRSNKKNSYDKKLQYRVNLNVLANSLKLHNFNLKETCISKFLDDIAIVVGNTAPYSVESIPCDMDSTACSVESIPCSVECIIDYIRDYNKDYNKDLISKQESFSKEELRINSTLEEKSTHVREKEEFSHNVPTESIIKILINKKITFNPDQHDMIQRFLSILVLSKNEKKPKLYYLENWLDKYKFESIIECIQELLSGYEQKKWSYISKKFADQRFIFNSISTPIRTQGIQGTVTYYQQAVNNGL